MSATKRLYTPEIYEELPIIGEDKGGYYTDKGYVTDEQADKQGFAVPHPEQCKHYNFNDYFEKCEDCGVTLDQLPEDLQAEFYEAINV